MRADIGPGDYVEALKPTPAYRGFIAVGVGSVHRVARMISSARCGACNLCGERGAVGILVEGDSPAPDYPAIRCLCGWRPIYRPKADLIEGLKQPVETREAVDA